MAVLVEHNVLLVLACFVVLLSEIAAQTSKHCANIVFPTLCVPYTLTEYEDSTVTLPFRLKTYHDKCNKTLPDVIFIYVYQPAKNDPFCNVRFTRNGHCTDVSVGKRNCWCDEPVSNGAVLEKNVTSADHGMWTWNSGDATVGEKNVLFTVHSGATDGLEGRGKNCTTTEGNVSIGNNNDNTRDHQDDEDDGGSLVVSVILGVLGVNIVTIIVVVVVVYAYRSKFSRKQGRHTGNPSPLVQEEEEYNVLQLHRCPEPRVSIQATTDEDDYGYAAVV